jgi:nucleoside-diphosphate-sugar epimerase
MGRQVQLTLSSHGRKHMASPILVTGAAGRVGAVGRTVTELLLKQGHPVRAMVRNEDERAKALRDMGAEVVVVTVHLITGHSRAFQNRPG